MKNLFKFKTYLIVFGITLLFTSCDDSEDEFVSPEGVWAGEVMLAGGEVLPDTLRLQDGEYTNEWYNEVRGEIRRTLGHAGIFSHNSQTIEFKPDSIFEGLWQFPNDSVLWSVKGSDRYDEYVGTFGGATFTSYYEIEGDNMIIKTDINNDGIFSLEREVTTFTRVD